jgi:hypothetical protein
LAHREIVTRQDEAEKAYPPKYHRQEVGKVNGFSGALGLNDWK